MLTENELQAIRERCDKAKALNLANPENELYNALTMLESARDIPALLDTITAIQSKLSEYERTPSIVYCKDCEYYAPPVVSRDIGVCVRLDRLAVATAFCSYGKQKEGNT